MELVVYRISREIALKRHFNIKFKLDFVLKWLISEIGGNTQEIFQNRVVVELTSEGGFAFHLSPA